MTDEILNRLIDQAMLEIADAQVSTSKEEASIMEYTDKDYAKLLADITSEDEDLAKAEIEAASNSEDTDRENADFLTKDILEDDFYNVSKLSIENGQVIRTVSENTLFELGEDKDVVVSEAPKSRYNNELLPTMGKTERQKYYTKKLQDIKKRKKKSRDLQKIEINRLAFDQKACPLAEEMTRWDKIVLVEELTKNIRQLIRRYEKYINTRVSRLLSPVIPASIKIAYLKWPHTFVANPGFLYKTHPESGEILTYWVTPSVPYFFKQGTVQQVLEERDAMLSPYFIECIDRAIHRWYEARRRLANREVSYASRIVTNNIRTYHDLLKYNPFWFKKLYDRVLVENEKDRNKKKQGLS